MIEDYGNPAYEETLWDKIDEKLQLWRVRDFIWKLRFYGSLLASPRKLSHLPELVMFVNHFADHEKGLAEDHANGKAGNCERTQRQHELMAEEYIEILGPFYECPE